MLQVTDLVLVFTHSKGKRKNQGHILPFIIKLLFLWLSTPLAEREECPSLPCLCFLLIHPAVGGSKWLWSKGNPAWTPGEIKGIWSSLHKDIPEDGVVLWIEWASPFVPRQLLSTQETSSNFGVLFCFECSCWALEGAAFRVHCFRKCVRAVCLLGRDKWGWLLRCHTAGQVCARAGHSAEGSAGSGSTVRQIWGIFAHLLVLSM